MTSHGIHPGPVGNTTQLPVRDRDSSSVGGNSSFAERLHAATRSASTPAPHPQARAPENPRAASQVAPSQPAGQAHKAASKSESRTKAPAASDAKPELNESAGKSQKPSGQPSDSRRGGRDDQERQPDQTSHQAARGTNSGPATTPKTKANATKASQAASSSIPSSAAKEDAIPSNQGISNAPDFVTMALSTLQAQMPFVQVQPTISSGSDADSSPSAADTSSDAPAGMAPVSASPDGQADSSPAGAASNAGTPSGDNPSSASAAQMTANVETPELSSPAVAAAATIASAGEPLAPPQPADVKSAKPGDAARKAGTPPSAARQPEGTLAPTLAAGGEQEKSGPTGTPPSGSADHAEAGHPGSKRFDGQTETVAAPPVSNGVNLQASGSNPAPDSAASGTSALQDSSTAPRPRAGTVAGGSEASSDPSMVASQDSRTTHPDATQRDAAQPAISAISTPVGAAVGKVEPSAIHPATQVALQPNTGLDAGAPKTPASVPPEANAAAQERAFAAWQSVSAQVGRIVSSATLNALPNGTEMRVQVRTDAFGPMDIRATLEAGKVGAAIGVESAEAHSNLVSQLSALQQSLVERQVQIDHIAVVRSFAESGTGLGADSRQQQDSTPSGGHPQPAWGAEQAPEPAFTPAAESWQPENSWGRLNVRA